MEDISLYDHMKNYCGTGTVYRTLSCGKSDKKLQRKVNDED